MLLQEMTWPEISNLSRDIAVVVPVAALEQHGHHMPVFTDSLLVGEVVRRVGAAMADRVREDGTPIPPPQSKVDYVEVSA